MPSMQSGFWNERIANTHNRTKRNTFCFYVGLHISVVRLWQDNMTASLHNKPNISFLLLFQLQLREQRTGISFGGYPSRAKQRHAVLCQGASVRGAVRPGTRNEGISYSLVSQGAAASTRTQEMESPSIGAEYNCLRRAK